MHLRIPGHASAATADHTGLPSALLCIHASGAWSYAGWDEGDDAWPVVAAFEV